jgi:formate/nitrite transporter FocA (FNT family)
MADLTLKNLWSLCRLWSIVFVANMVGTFVAALFCNFTPVLSPELRAVMLGLSGQLLDYSWPEMLFKGIAAGFLIAAMVWLLPGADTAQFSVVVLMTYLISAGGFTHIVAGSVEAFMLVLNGHLGWWSLLADFAVPVLLGNIVGGTALFALLAYAQVMKEI